MMEFDVDTMLYMVVGAIFLLVFVFSGSDIPLVGRYLGTIFYYFRTIPGIIVLGAAISVLSMLFDSLIDVVKEVVAALLVAVSTYGIVVAFEIDPATMSGAASAIGLGGNLVGFALTAIVVMFVYGIFAGIYKSSGGDIGQLMGAALVVAVIVYFMLGPWSHVVKRYIGFVKEPMIGLIEMGAAQADEMKLLFLDPWTWVQRQQMKNAASDDINPPVGVEITAIDNAIGNTLVHGQEAMFVVNIKNKGEHIARNVVVGYECERCKTKRVEINKGDLYPLEEDYAELYLVPVPDAPEGATQSSIDVKYFVSYTYSTDTMLQVSIMRKEDADERGYSQVLSNVDNSPAVLSLNVGRQPKIAGREYGLMIAFLKQKIGGVLDLSPSTAEVLIPKKLTTTAPSCSGKISSSVSSRSIDGEDYWVVSLNPGGVRVTKSGIAYVVCKLVAPVPEPTYSISGAITAHFRNYRFTATKRASYAVDLVGGEIVTGS